MPPAEMIGDASMDIFTAYQLADATRAERLREADHRPLHESDYAVIAATCLPPRNARGDWQATVRLIVDRRVAAGPPR